MKVPEYTRQVSDGGPERVRRSPLDSGSAMSAVAAEGRGAQGVAGALGDLSGVFGKIAADADEAKIMAAANDYMTKSTSLLYDSEKGLLNAQGAGAEGLSERSAMAHKSFADDIASKLTARQRKHFYETVANYDRSAGRSVMAHENKALSDYRTGEAKKLLANTAVTFSKSPNELSMEAQEDLIRSITLGMFGDQGEEGNIKNSDLIRSALIQQTIANIAVNDPMAAETFFEKHKSLMEPAAAEEVKNTLDKAALPVKAQALAKKLFEDTKGDITAGYKYIEENVPVAQQSVFKSEFDGYYADMKRAEAAQRDSVQEQFYGLYNKKSSYTAAKNFLIKNKPILGEQAFAAMSETAQRLWEVGRYAPKAQKRELTRNEIIAASALGIEAKEVLASIDMKDAAQMKKFSDTYGAALEAITGDNKMFIKLINDNSKQEGETEDDRKIRVSYASAFKEKMKIEKIDDINKQGNYEDRFNYEYSLAVKEAKQKGRTVTNKDALEIMDAILLPEKVGEKRGYMGGKNDMTVRRGDIPLGAERGADGRWYIKDGNSYRQLIFTNDGRILNSGYTRGSIE